MEDKTLDLIIKVAVCVCGKDGVISVAEEKAIFSIISSEYPHYSFQRFNQTVDDFFDDNLQLEDYLGLILDPSLNKFTVNLCESSASSDGLDIKENIALDKVKLILGEKL